MIDYDFDIESFPNFFSAVFKAGNVVREFEISWRKNQTKELEHFTAMCRENGDRWVGFNNLGYDYPVMHYLLNNSDLVEKMGPLPIYNESMRIIGTPWNSRFQNQIWESEHIVQQIDLFTLHHFDNPARSTSLKILEFNMRRDRVLESSVPFGTLMTFEQMSEVLCYNHEDVDATAEFHQHSIGDIEFREQLGNQWGVNIINHNATKIGKDHFIRTLEERSPGSCYTYEGKKKVRRNTKRDKIVLNDIIFDYVKFDHPEFRRVLQYFRSKTITETKGVFTDLTASVNGIDFDFGTGGIHASIESCTVVSDDEYAIIDIDVTSYYPNLAIANRVYPAHLGETFCDVYQELFEERKKHPKGSIQNAALKLALNGTFGDTNFEHSALYDPQYAMQITVNGQLLICMLAEALMKHKSLRLIQANTDGVTVKVPRADADWVKDVMRWWEGLTGLQLEDVEYTRMFIRDVNNYIGEFTDGSLKRKGAYEWKKDWHQDQSALIVAKAAEAALVHNVNIRTFIEQHKDPFDFLLRTKVPRSGKLVSVDYGNQQTIQQNVSRYAITIIGDDLYKVLPPTNNQMLAGKTNDRWIQFHKTYKVQVCNDITHLNPDEIEFEYYITEAEKLVDPLLQVY